MDENAADGASRGVEPPGELNPRREPVLDFRDRPIGEMTPGDYDALGFLSGLEVHQQLRTRSKLFCRCPAGRPARRVDAEVLRHMRPTLSELGEYDGTALMEFKTRKEIVYLLDRETVCTYEMDDTPPFPIDMEAVGIAVELATLCDLSLVSELHVMRKQYLDGSIPTGFQRTAMVGLTGVIPFRVPSLGVDRELRIRQLSLEEDSCREVSDVGHRIVFRTDRLGMPLTEVVTEPDLLTPWELQAGGRLIADIARATGRVRRGPGAARQDVNVSVAGGRRIEIKGVHHHRGLPLLVHTEAFRQLNLLRIKAELERRGVPADALAPPEGTSGARDARPWQSSALVVDATSLLRDAGYEPARRAVERGETVCAVRLPGFAGLLDHPTQPGTTFAHELADRVRVIACPVHRPFLTHDGDANGVGAARWREVRGALGAGADDAMVLVWAQERDAATAAREVLIRAREAFDGVPAETRQARGDGTTGFERILPGADRMYPDTDTPPLPIPDNLVVRIRARLPETPWDRRARYRALGLDAEAAHRLARAPWADLFDALEPGPGDVARRLETALRHRVPFHARRSAAAPADVLPDPDRLALIVRAVEAGALRPDALVLALDEALERPGEPTERIVDRYRPRPDDRERLRARVAAVAGRAHALAGKPAAAVVRWGMGEVMRGLRGRVDPVEARTWLERALDAEELGVAS